MSYLEGCIKGAGSHVIALVDPTRRAILERLSSGEARVTELAARFPISQLGEQAHPGLLERASSWSGGLWGAITFFESSPSR